MWALLRFQEKEQCLFWPGHFSLRGKLKHRTPRVLIGPSHCRRCNLRASSFQGLLPIYLNMLHTLCWTHFFNYHDYLISVLMDKATVHFVCIGHAHSKVLTNLTTRLKASQAKMYSLVLQEVLHKRSLEDGHAALCPL